jgi:hypothetical protein
MYVGFVMCVICVWCMGFTRFLSCMRFAISLIRVGFV